MDQSRLLRFPGSEELGIVLNPEPKLYFEENLDDRSQPSYREDEHFSECITTKNETPLDGHKLCTGIGTCEGGQH